MTNTEEPTVIGNQIETGKRLLVVFRVLSVFSGFLAGWVIYSFVNSLINSEGNFLVPVLYGLTALTTSLVAVIITAKAIDLQHFISENQTENANTDIKAG
jgi:ATP/ADP translocase